MKISATVTLKKEVLDPQGKVINQTLKNMGYKKVVSVRQGKFFNIELDETDKEKAKSDRISQQNTEQSELINQRKNNLPPKNFESNEDSLDGFDLAEFEPR